jgi:hypothetical protein
MTIFRKLIVVFALALAACGFGVVQQVTPASGLNNCSTSLGGSAGSAVCWSSSGAIKSFQVMVRCAGSSVWHYGNRVYLAAHTSTYVCPGGLTATQAGIQFYY